MKLEFNHLPAVALLAAVLVPAGASAETRRLAFDEDGWELSGDDTRLEEFLGEPALRIRTGRAIRRDVRLEDGTIEFDVALTAFRSFVYIQFRMQSDEEHEEIYLRPHKTLLPDAIQYTPVFRGSSQWQLFHDASAAATAEFPADEWIHVRLELSGRKAALFIGDSAEPQLVVARLARDPAAGYIALRSFLPRGDPPGVYPANYANVMLRPGETSYDFSGVEDPAPAGSDVVQQWQVSPAFDPQDGSVLVLPTETSGEWSTAATEPSGLLLLERQVTRPEGVRRAATLARLTLKSDRERTVRFDFGYSDEISVFLNGRLLFSGNDRYSFNFPRRQGLITIDQGSLYLPLLEGENDLVLAVTDVFGGWGLMGRFEPVAELEIE